MFLPKLREIKEALTSFFSAPYTTKFPAEPFTAAKEYRGHPRYNAEFCIGCGTCSQVCPSGAISFEDDIKNVTRTLTVDYNVCINCGQCQEHCITERGIILTNEHSLAYMDKTVPESKESLERELAICESCGKVVACKSHLVWIKERLGAKAYAHPNLILQTQEQFFNVEPYHVKSQIRREDQFKMVCAKCRNMIVVADEF